MTSPDGDRPLFEDLPEHPAPAAAGSKRPRLGDRIVDVDLIDDDRDHARRTVDAEDLSALAESLAALGQVQPIVVRPSIVAPGRFVVVVGRRRLLAARRAKIGALRAVVFETEKPLALQLAENLARAKLHPVDEAVAVCEAARFFDSAEALARAVGRSPSHVSRCRRIVDIDVSILEALRRKACAFSVALELADPTLTDAQRMAAIAGAGDRLTSGDVAAARRVRPAEPRGAPTPQALCRRICKPLAMVLDEFKNAGADLDRMTVPELLDLIRTTAKAQDEH
jgi:ParB family chromosome partitioning protein